MTAKPAVLAGPGIAHLSPYQYEPLNHEYSIRLLVLEPGNRDDQLHCHFESTNLKAKIVSEYEAISYTWGEALPTHTIFIGNGTLEVRVNILHALRHFRHERECRVLWADAICINQNDISERNQQVSIMREVYETSTSTLVWLGESFDPEHLALTLIKRCEDVLQQKISSLPDAIRSIIVEILLKAESQEKLTWEAKTESLAAFFSKPWFVRVWILQELAVSKKVIFFCGQAHISLLAVETCLNTIGANFTESGIALSNAIRIPSSLFWFRACYQSGYYLPLTDALYYTCGMCKATDAKDCIFALAGILDKQARKSITIDYSIETSKLFTRAMAYCCVASKDPFPLLSLVAGVPPGQLRPVLPSWVPDFSSALGFIRNYSQFNVFSAHGGSALNMSVDGNVIKILGKIVDSVNVCEQCPESPIGLAPAREWYRRCNDIACQTTMPYNEPTDSTWWRLMICDICYDTVDTRNSPRAAQKFGENYLKEGLSAPYWIENAALSTVSTVRDEQERYHLTMRSTSLAVSFCATEKQRIGWVPPATQMGDKICIFTGSQAPFVLRERVSGIYSLIGDCYLHGIMYGEAINWSKDEWDLIELR